MKSVNRIVAVLLAACLAGEPAAYGSPFVVCLAPIAYRTPLTVFFASQALALQPAAQPRPQPFLAEVLTQSTRRRDDFGIAWFNGVFDRMRARVEFILQLFTEDQHARDLPKPVPRTPQDSPPEPAPVPAPDSKYTHNQLMDMGNRQLRKFGIALEPFLPLSIGSAIRAEVIEHQHPLFFELLALSVPFEFMHALMAEALECPVEFSPRSVWDAVNHLAETPPWMFWEKLFDGKASRIVLDMLLFENAWPIRTFAGLDEDHKIKLLDWMAKLSTELAKKLVFALARDRLVPVVYQRHIADWWKRQVSFSFSNPMTIHHHEPSYHAHEHPHELGWYFGWFYDGFTETEQTELRAWLFTAGGLYLKGYYADVAAGIAEALYQKLSPPEKARVHEWLVGNETGLNNQYTHYHAFVLLERAFSFMSRIERDAVHRWAMEVLKDNAYRPYPDYGRQAAGLWIANHFDDFSSAQKEEFLHWFYEGPESAIQNELMGQSMAGTDWITPLTVQTSAFLTGDRKRWFRKEWLFGPASGLRGSGYMLRLAALRILARDFMDFDEKVKLSYDAWFLQYRKASARPDRKEFYELALDHDYSTDDWVQLYKKLDGTRQQRLMNYMRGVMGPVAYDPTQNLPMKSRNANGSRVILRYSPAEDIYWVDHGQHVDFEYAVGGELFGGAKYQTDSERESAILFMQKLYPDLSLKEQHWILAWLHAPWAGLRHYNHPTRHSASHLFIRIHREEILAQMRRAA